MSDSELFEEFEFLREKLKKVAHLLVNLDQSSLMEAAFIIGCLHSICCENAEKLSKQNAPKAI